MKTKIDTAKLANTAANALVSAVFGGLGSYVVHRVTRDIEKKCAQQEKNEKRKIGFDIQG